MHGVDVGGTRRHSPVPKLLRTAELIWVVDSMTAMAGNKEIDFNSIAALVAILLAGTSANDAGVSLPAVILKNRSSLDPRQTDGSAAWASFPLVGVLLFASKR